MLTDALNGSRSILSTHLDALLDGLLDDLRGQVGGDLPDVHALGEGGTPAQVVLGDELDQGLGRTVDHGVGHHARLPEGRAEGKAGEDVPGKTKKEGIEKIGPAVGWDFEDW